MAFESVRGYFQLASGLGELSRARAMEAAQGLLSMPGVAIATGKVAGQVGALAEELLAAATTNREHLTTLVRSEVDAAVTRLGLVPAEKLEESRAEVARLRAEVAALRSTSSTKAAAAKRTAAAAKTAPRPRSAAKRSTAKTSTAKTSTAKTSTAKTAARSTPATRAAAKPVAIASAITTPGSAAKATPARRSAVTTRRRPSSP